MTIALPWCTPSDAAFSLSVSPATTHLPSPCKSGQPLTLLLWELFVPIILESEGLEVQQTGPAVRAYVFIGPGTKGRGSLWHLWATVVAMYADKYDCSGSGEEWQWSERSSHGRRRRRFRWAEGSFPEDCSPLPFCCTLGTGTVLCLPSWCLKDRQL